MTTIPSGTNLWVEPPSAANVDTPPEYPYNHVQHTESGHTFELDDTPSRERIRLQHRSKTFIEMHPNGDEVHKIVGDGYEIIAGRKNVLISGDCNITINGNCNLQVKGDFNQQVNGDYTLAVKGKMDVRAVKEINLAGDADVSIAANENFGGRLRLSAATALSVGSDLYVSGSITCDTLTAESRVTGGMGVTAGPAGFTSGLGGLSLGFPTPATPIAEPGCINIIGTMMALGPVITPMSVYAGMSVDAGMSVLAPSGTFGSMSAGMMSDMVNRAIYDTHTHLYLFPLVPGGVTVTGLPLPMFVPPLVVGLAGG